MLEKGIIENSAAVYLAPIVLVDKWPGKKKHVHRLYKG